MAITFKRKFIAAHMDVAFRYSELSKATRLKVGAILVKHNAPLSIGYNGLPAGADDSEMERDGVSHPHMQHAEKNALKKLWKLKETGDDTVMFVTDSPCEFCAIDIVDAGIKAVFFERAYRLDAGIKYLLNHDVRVYRLKRENEGAEYRLYSLCLRHNEIIELFNYTEIITID